MKKIFIAAISCILAFGSMASNPGSFVPEKFVDEFHRTFPEAELTSWSKVRTCWVAGFKQDGHVYSAYFNEFGKCFGYGRFINGDEIPAYVSGLISYRQPTWTVSKVFEYNSKGKKGYYVTLTSSDASRIVLVDELANLITVSRNGKIMPYIFPGSEWEY